MNKRIFRALFCIAVFCVGASAQDVDDEDVVKITSKLVQVDVVVTDKDGNQVTGLKASDFTILQDGKPQTVSGFSYIPMGGSGQVPAEKRDKADLLVPQGPLRSGTR
ncbi:MAG: hypothetical protein ABI646_11075, partial [Acidobacteriota bacterium]